MLLCGNVIFRFSSGSLLNQKRRSIVMSMFLLVLYFIIGVVSGIATGCNIFYLDERRRRVAITLVCHFVGQIILFPVAIICAPGSMKWILIAGSVFGILMPVTHKICQATIPLEQLALRRIRFLRALRVLSS